MKTPAGLHERFDRDEAMRAPSPRRFGLTMAVVFCLFFALAAYHQHWVKALFLLAIAALFLFTALFSPSRLSALNHGWMRFGLLLHRITNPIVMALIYLLAIVPVGLLLKLFGKDPLRRAFQPDAPSYWIPREPGPTSDTMRNQF